MEKKGPKTWHQIEAYLRWTHDAGHPLDAAQEDVIPARYLDYWDADEPIREYNLSLTKDLAACIECVQSRAEAEGRSHIITRIERLLEQATRGRAAIDKLTVLAPESFVRRDEPPFRQQLFTKRLLRLIQEVDERAERPERQGRSQDDKEFWTVEELAQFRGVSPNTIRKEVSYYRRAHKRDPSWVRRFPGKQRGFTIRWITYRLMMQAAPVQGRMKRR
jgi:hypothetical protein